MRTESEICVARGLRRKNRHPKTEKFLRHILKQCRLCRHQTIRNDINRGRNLLNRLANLNELCRPSLGVRFELAPLRPLICLIVMVDIAQQQAVSAAMNDQANITTDAYGPKIRITGGIQLVELHTRVRRIQLQIEGRRLDNLLLIACQSGEAVREHVSAIRNCIRLEPPQALRSDLPQRNRVLHRLPGRG